MNLEDLLVKITGDTTGLKSAVASGNAELDTLGAGGAAKGVEKDAAGAAGGVAMLGGSAKAAEKDVGGLTKGLSAGGKEMGALEKAAGGGTSGLLSMATGLTGIPGPAMVVGVALAGTALVMDEAAKTSEKVKKQEDQLGVALKDHGENLDALRPKIDAAIKSGEQYGYNADDTRAAITKMTEAGISMSDVEAGLPSIMDLARAKNIDLASATEIYTKAMMGSAKGLKDLGILLPSVTAASADAEKAQTKLTAATDKVTAASAAVTQAQFAVQKANDVVVTAAEKLKLAQEQLAVTETNLGGKHKMTAQDAITLQKAHDAVTTASNNLAAAHLKVGDATDAVDKATLAVTAAQADQKSAQDALTLAEQGGVDKSARLALINKDLTKAVGDQKTTATSMEIAQAKLNDTWEKFAVKIGPPVQKAFAALVDIAGQVADQASILIDDVSALWGWLEQTGIINAVATSLKVGLIDPFLVLVGILQKAVDILKTVLKGAQDAAKAIADSPIGTIAGAAGGGLGFLGGLIPHAAGGPVSPGKAYLVGERGPEAFVSGQSGAILPTGALGGGKGGATVNMTINNPVPEPASRSAFHAGLMLAALGYVEPGG